MIRTACLLFGLALFLAANRGRAELTVATDFEGGSARVLEIDQATGSVRFMPGGDPARGWPCWWYLRVDGVKIGQTLTFTVVASDRPISQKGSNEGKPLSVSWSTPLRAAVSSDGRTWTQTSPGEKRADGMSWRVQAESERLWVAWGPPFTGADAKALVARLAEQKDITAPFVLARTREDREVHGIRVRAGARPDEERPAVWVQARQHAWESGGSWVCRGFAEWVASEDPNAAWLREHADVYIVPVMDVDHVATGDGGKEALPQDHNRDWSDQPHWPEVAAAQKRLGALAAENRLSVFLDLHNPGRADLGSYFYTGEESLAGEVGLKSRDRFLALAQESFKGPIPYDPRSRPSGAAYHPLWRQISGNWVTTRGNPNTVSLCLETAWNTPSSHIDGYLATGRQLAQAVAAYLRETTPP